MCSTVQKKVTEVEHAVALGHMPLVEVTTKDGRTDHGQVFWSEGTCWVFERPDHDCSTFTVLTSDIEDLEVVE